MERCSTSISSTAPLVVGPTWVPRGMRGASLIVCAKRDVGTRKVKPGRAARSAPARRGGVGTGKKGTVKKAPVRGTVRKGTQKKAAASTPREPVDTSTFGAAAVVGLGVTVGGALVGLNPYAGQKVNQVTVTVAEVPAPKPRVQTAPELDLGSSAGSKSVSSGKGGFIASNPAPPVKTAPPLSSSPVPTSKENAGVKVVAPEPAKVEKTPAKPTQTPPSPKPEPVKVAAPATAPEPAKAEKTPAKSTPTPPSPKPEPVQVAAPATAPEPAKAEKTSAKSTPTPPSPKPEPVKVAAPATAPKASPAPAPVSGPSTKIATIAEAPTKEDKESYNPKASSAFLQISVAVGAIFAYFLAKGSEPRVSEPEKKVVRAAAAPVQAAADTDRPPAKEWIENWRKNGSPAAAAADDRESAKEWIANWREKSKGNENEGSEIGNSTSGNNENATSAKEWISNWRNKSEGGDSKGEGNKSEMEDSKDAEEEGGQKKKRRGFVSWLFRRN